MLLCGVMASAQHYNIGGINYSITSSTDLTMSVVYSTNGYSGDIVIPSTVTYGGKSYSVTSIAGSAFENDKQVTSVSIPESVTSIGDYAFRGCSSMETINYPPNCRSGLYAFQGCTGELTLSCNVPQLEINTNPKTYGYFYGSKFTSVIVDENVTKVGGCAFWNCNTIKSVTLSETVTTISGRAFYGCSSLSTINLPNSLVTIGDYAFYGCSILTSVNIPNSVTTIGSYAFYGCSSIPSVLDIPESVTSIGAYAYSNCTSLTTVIIGNSVETIGESAFSGCTGMSDLTIGSSVATIGQKAFADCSNLMNIYALNPKAITCNVNIFHTDAYNNATLYVPEGREQAYAKTTPWMKFYIQTLVVPEKSHSVTIGAAGYATLYLDYAVERPRGVEAYYVSRVSGDVAVLKAVWDYIPAHTGVILRGSAGTYTFAYTTAQVQPIPQNMLRGTTVDTEIPAEPGITYYALGRSNGVVGLYAGKIVDGCFFNNANKAYLPLPSDEEAGGTEQLSRGFTLSFPEHTGVEAMESVPEAPALIYDLQGRRLTAITERGIYIVNGKKVVR